MIGTLIGIIFALIVLGVLWWALQQLLGLIPLPEPFRTIIYVLSVVIMVLIVLWIISVLLGMAGVHVPRFGFRGEPDRSLAAISASLTGYLSGMLT